LHYLGAFSWIRETFCCFPISCADFTLKNFSGLLLFMEIECAKLEHII
jgi:hypothetical protein